MILDSSALVAVLLREPEHERLIERLSENPEPGIGAPSMVESGIVLTARLGPQGQSLLGGFLAAYRVLILPFDAEHWTIAVQAFQRFGKGRHPAALNFGDCLTYATARVAAEPLLCIGEDFAKTDLPILP